MRKIILSLFLFSILTSNAQDALPDFAVIDLPVQFPAPPIQDAHGEQVEHHRGYRRAENDPEGCVHECRTARGGGRSRRKMS